MRDLGKGGAKRVDKIGKEMIKSGLMLSKPTSYGLEVSLNSQRSQEIMNILKKVFAEYE